MQHRKIKLFSFFIYLFLYFYFVPWKQLDTMKRCHIYNWEGRDFFYQTINTEILEGFIRNSKTKTENKIMSLEKQLTKCKHIHKIILPGTLFNQLELKHLKMAGSGRKQVQVKRKGSLHLPGREHWKNQAKIKEQEVEPQSNAFFPLGLFPQN